MILYIETNFIVGAALGREPRYEELLATSRDELRICLPDVCIMEALSTLGALSRTRNRFGGELERQANELRRLPHSNASRSLLVHLERAIIANSGIEEEVSGRLWHLLSECSETSFGRIRLLPVDWRAMHLLMSRRPTGDPTDNLILSIICSYAEHLKTASVETHQALLTGNTRDFDDWFVRDRLSKAGIEHFFPNAEAVLGWLQGHPDAA